MSGCCVCSSSQQACTNCRCVKAGNRCRDDCRKGSECRNKPRGVLAQAHSSSNSSTHAEERVNVLGYDREGPTQEVQAANNEDTNQVNPDINSNQGSQPSQNNHNNEIQGEDRMQQDMHNERMETAAPALIWNGQNIEELKSLVDEVYDDIANFKNYNIFEPPSCNSMKLMLNEMRKVILDYVLDTALKPVALKLLMCMPKLLLQQTHPKAKAKENAKAFSRRMEAWMKGELKLLHLEAKAIQGRLNHHKYKHSEEDKARQFRKKMESGSVNQASRLLQLEEGGEIVEMNEETICKLKEKHPQGTNPPQEYLLEQSAEPAHPVTYEAITGDMIRKAALETKGAAGPSGMNAKIWRRILTSMKHQVAATGLRDAVARLARKLCTQECIDIEPLTASRLIPLKKHPNGVRPIGIGEVLRRIIGHCVMKVVRKDVTKSAGNLQVCAGQYAGGEAAIHAMRMLYEDEGCEAVLLIDASNAFNTLNRKAMLHNVAVLCPSIAMYARNTYSTSPRLFIMEGLEIKSEEGTTQGDPIAMAVYALGLSVLQRKIDQEITGAKHVAFADDLGGAGKLEAIKKLWDAVSIHGPPLGYHPNASKSCLIVKASKEEEAKQIFAGTNIQITTAGERHLGAVIGSDEFKVNYIKKKVDTWVDDVNELSKIAKTEPHAAYTNFIFSIKHRWNYAMRTIPGISQHLHPLESSIANTFIPALIGHNASRQLRDLLSLPARMGGMGIINPVKVADQEYQNSVRLTEQLTGFIIAQDRISEVDESKLKEVKTQISQERETWQKNQWDEIKSMENLNAEEMKRIEMNKEKGASNWLTSLPLKDMGFSLNKQEFRDAVALRYGLPVTQLHETCSCGSNFTMEHAMICKTGGFVSLRHNEVRDITHEMLKEVCREGVEKEPILLPLTGEQLHHRTANTRDDARLDICARGFWTRGERAFCDIRVFDPLAPSYNNLDLVAAHRRQESEKRRAYEERVINVEHGSFTPLVFTIAGGMGQEAQKFYGRLAEMLTEQRHQPKSVVVAWMRCRLSFSLLRSAILCLRGSRARRPQILMLEETNLAVAVAEGRVSVLPSDRNL